MKGVQIVNLARDLARALSVQAIRVVETIPGTSCMGLEIPNPKREIVRLAEIVGSQAYAEMHSKLTLALGKDITGKPVVADLARMPHLLVAGTTGSGKSVAINAMILSLIYKATSKDVRFIMIDPKMLELSAYDGIPHLLAPVLTDMRQAQSALNWCVGEMDNRYRLMSAIGVRNVATYNQRVHEAIEKKAPLTNPFTLTPESPEPLEALPLIVLVIDELADLMMVSGKKVEELIARIAQKSRASGIHLMLATQRPSVDVITGLIKANVPTRIAFQVSSKVDSRTILDQMGAESLLGQGDMLYSTPGHGLPTRVHGAYVADAEVHRVVEALKKQGEAQYVDEILEAPDAVERVPLSSRLSIWRWDWMPDGRLVIPQGPDIRIVSTTGSESVVASNMRHPPDQAASCGGGKYIVFRQFGGVSGVATNLWRIDAAGTNLKQLTFGLNESDPECSLDGKWVYYVDRGDNRYLKRIFLEGGLAETVIYAPTGLYALSPDGKTIVKDEVRDSDHQLMLALYSIEEKKKSYIEYDQRALGGYAFLPDGKSVAYVVREKAVDNLWTRPVDGSPSRPLTHFTSESIYSFRYSPDGAKVAIERGHMESDAVLLRDASQ